MKIGIGRHRILSVVNNNSFHYSSCANHEWKRPAGRETGVLVYNVVAKKKVPLLVDNSTHLTWYSCGPTVYDVTHIGHASSYMRLDIIQRLLKKWFGVKCIVALGITDIDDKILNKSKALQEDCSFISKKYEMDFFQAITNLKITKPHFILRVTENIPEILNFVGTIIQSGNAYVLEDGSVYFNTRSLPTYGKVTRTPVPQDEIPASSNSRRNAADFALWKAAKPGELSWSSPWGPGRPGWHIECSAMASKIFGKKLDVHTGGLDLAFPHHENEEAQSCAYHATNQWVNYWIHTGHLLMNGMKMSKSMKNFVPVTTFLEQYRPDDLRMLCLLTHYRSSIDYTDEGMKKSVALINKFQTFLGDARSYCRGSWNRGNISGPKLQQLVESTRQRITTCLADDFNTPQCMNHLENLVKEMSIMLHDDSAHRPFKDVPEVAYAADFVEDSLQSLGLLQSTKSESENELTSEVIIEKAVIFRQQVRSLALALEDKSSRSQLLKLCDKMRADMKLAKINVKDNSNSSSSWNQIQE